MTGSKCMAMQRYIWQVSILYNWLEYHKEGLSSLLELKQLHLFHSLSEHGL